MFTGICVCACVCVVHVCVQYSLTRQHACVRASMREVLTCMLTHWGCVCVCVWCVCVCVVCVCVRYSLPGQHVRVVCVCVVRVCVYACGTYFHVSTFGLPFPSQENLIDSNSLIRRVGVTVIVTSGATVNQTHCQSNQLSIKQTVNQTN